MKNITVFVRYPKLLTFLRFDVLYLLGISVFWRDHKHQKAKKVTNQKNQKRRASNKKETAQQRELHLRRASRDRVFLESHRGGDGQGVAGYLIDTFTPVH